MTKSPEMESFLNNLAQQMFGRTRQDNCCVTCGSEKIAPEDFRNAISLKEFGISHMCQKCQDDTFGND